MVVSGVVVAFAPEERTFATRTCAVLIGSRLEASVTERFAVVVISVAAVLVRDATGIRSPSDARVRALYIIARCGHLGAGSDLP